MFIQFTLNKIKAEKVLDNPYNPFDTRAELYQTWQMCDLEPMVPLEETPKSYWAQQGFSVKGAPDDGTSFSEGEERKVDDPHIAFKLPELADGDLRRFRLDIHWWESDASTEKVRGAFTPTTLKILVKAWKAANEDEKRAKAALEEWIKENADDVAKAAAIVAGVSGQPWVSVALDMLPLFALIVDVVRNNSDDYIAMHRFILEIKKENGSTLWRVTGTGEESVPPWIVGEGTQKMIRSIEDGTGEIAATATYRCRVLE